MKNSTSATARAVLAIQEQFAREQDTAKRALRDLVLKATRELENLDAGQFTRTDWVEQPARQYSESLTKMSAIGEALSVVTFLASQEK